MKGKLKLSAVLVQIRSHQETPDPHRRVLVISGDLEEHDTLRHRVMAGQFLRARPGDTWLYLDELEPPKLLVAGKFNRRLNVHEPLSAERGETHP
jgi:hypothetical protein